MLTSSFLNASTFVVLRRCHIRNFFLFLVILLWFILVIFFRLELVRASIRFAIWIVHFSLYLAHLLRVVEIWATWLLLIYIILRILALMKANLVRLVSLILVILASSKTSWLHTSLLIVILSRVNSSLNHGLLLFVHLLLLINILAFFNK